MLHLNGLGRAWIDWDSCLEQVKRGGKKENDYRRGGHRRRGCRGGEVPPLRNPAIAGAGSAALAGRPAKVKWHKDTRSLASVAAERPTGRREDMGGSRKVD